MEEEINEYFDMARESMDGTITHLERELSKVNTGKANPRMVSGLFVSYYGADTPLNQVANVSIADARTITIQPWEKSMIGPIERAIFEANLGVTPQNDGEMVRITIPPLTEDRLKDLVKVAKNMGEDAKISLRSARKDLMDGIKDAVKDGYPEDAGKRKESDANALIKTYEAKVEDHVKNKEKDILTI